MANDMEILQVQTLGDFVLHYNGKLLSGENVRARQVWNLLEYLIVNRGGDTSQDRLIEALWEDDEVENPVNALKNLVYRLRSVLKSSLDLPVSDYIIYKHGSYGWNPQAPCVIDADILEETMEAAKRGGEEERYRSYTEAASIYKGDFMPQASYKPWVRAKAIYYQNLYMEAMEGLSGILLERERFSEAEAVCQTAIDRDPFVEINHINLIRALVGSNNQKKAREHYEAVCRLYMDELGISPSDTITELYMNIINQNREFERDLAVIKNELNESGDVSGALECNFEVFKMIYRLEARAALRTGGSVYLALLTVAEEDGEPLTADWSEHRVNGVLATLCAFLRKNDVVCRYGRTQFLIMLSNITYEDMGIVMNRLICRINQLGEGTGTKVTVHGQVRALDPVELEGTEHV